MDKYVEWFDLSGAPHERTFSHQCRLTSLPHEWERELAALWRLEADVNNGAYLQFLGNWGRESYVYSSSALKKIGAVRMARIIDACQALVDEHCASPTAETLAALPHAVAQRILDLSYEFMKYPEDVVELGLSYYRPIVEGSAWPEE